MISVKLPLSKYLQFLSLSGLREKNKIVFLFQVKFREVLGIEIVHFFPAENSKTTYFFF